MGHAMSRCVTGPKRGIKLTRSQGNTRAKVPSRRIQEMLPVGRDSVEPTLLGLLGSTESRPTERAGESRLDGVSPHRKSRGEQARRSLAPPKEQGRVGSTESRPTERVRD